MRTTLSVLTGVALICLAAPLAAQDDSGGPRMIVPEKVKDLGEVSKGDVLEAEFKLVNEGDEPLLIKAVRPTCGCTVADYDREVPPGGEGSVKAKLDTTDFSGPISKSILIMSNDTSSPTMTVVIKADVQPHVEVLPRPLIRFNAVVKEELVQTITVVATEEDRAFQITKVDSSVDYLTTTVRELEEDERFRDRSKTQYEIAVGLSDDAEVGPVSGRLMIHTDHPNAKLVPVKVFGVVRAALNVTPPQIQFGTVDADMRPGRNVIVVNNRTGGKKVEVTGAAIDDPAFKTALRSMEDGRRYQVTVTIDPEAGSGARDAVLTLKTTDVDYPELSVPVRANIR
jgi:hypothetical protein